MRRPVLAAALVIVPSLGCADDVDSDVCPAEVEMVHLVSPSSAVELIPGAESVVVTWAPPIDYQADVMLVGPGDLSAHFPVSLTVGELSIEAAQLEPEIFHVGLAVTCDENTVRVVPGGGTSYVFRQGATMAPFILSFDATQPQEDRQLEVHTVSRSTMELEVLADQQVIVRESIPGELTSMTRRYPFTGLDVDGAPVPEGMHALTIRVHARNGTLTYDRPGPMLYWAP